MTDVHAHEAFVDNGVVVVSEVDPSYVENNLPAVSHLLPPQVVRAIASWAEDASPSRSQRNRSLFARDRYVTPGKVFEQMAVCYDALDDDVVGSVADMSESLAFQKVTFESEDADQENVWSQVGRDLDVDSWFRTAWRELFTVSQFYAVVWWGRNTYRVKAKRDKRIARKEFTLNIPVRLGFLDPTRVVPVSNDLFGGSQYAWIVTDEEKEQFDRMLVEDPLVSTLFVDRYRPSEKEKSAFSNEDIPADNLMLLNPRYVFGHSLTKSPFERWARIRLKSILPLLDMKHQIRNMDRAWLLGGINFLVLVTKGSDQKPATVAEVESVAAQMRTQSTSPVIISDHRLNIEIITPNVEHVVSKEKWNTIDESIQRSLWGMFVLPSVSGRETSMSMARLVARGLANRRHMLRRAFERHVIRPVIEDPMNRDAGFTAETSIEFAPRRMELEFDPNVVTMIQELRDRGDLSRETVLNEFNFSQDLEARRREKEDEQYDDVFTPVNVPFDSPNRVTPGGSGRQGGRPPGSSQDNGE